VCVVCFSLITYSNSRVLLLQSSLFIILQYSIFGTVVTGADSLVVAILHIKMISAPLLPKASSSSRIFNWDTFLPFEIRWLKQLLCVLGKRARLYGTLYLVFIVVSLGFLISLLAQQWSDNDLKVSLNTVLFYMLYVGMGLAYITFPPIYMIYFKQLLESDHVPQILSSAMRQDEFFKRRFHLICHFNFAMIVGTLVLYDATYSMPWYIRVMSIFMGPVYTIPNVLAYTLCIMILDALRVQAQCLQRDLEVDLMSSLDWGGADEYDSEGLHLGIEVKTRVSEKHDMSSGIIQDAVDSDTGLLFGGGESNAGLESLQSVIDGSSASGSGGYDNKKALSIQKHVGHIRLYWRRYCTVHSDCFRSSKLCGRMLVLLFCVSFVVVVSTVWDIFKGIYTVVSLLGYSLHSLVLLHEAMLLLVMINETGNIICCRLSALAMHGVVQCFNKSHLLRLTSSRGSDRIRMLNTLNLGSNVSTGRDSMGGNCVGSCSSGVDNDHQSEVNAHSLHAPTPSDSDLVVEEVKTLIGCLAVTKIQVTFFGEFGLRSRMLLAIVGSIFGAVVSAIYLR
jgi:hypothetical protein